MELLLPACTAQNYNSDTAHESAHETLTSLDVAACLAPNTACFADQLVGVFQQPVLEQDFTVLIDLFGSDHKSSSIGYL